MLIGCISFTLTANATHLVGGYMNYTFLSKLANGDSRYRVSFNVYRDCDNGIPLEDEINVGVYLNDAAKSRNQVVKFNMVLKERVQAPGNVDCPDIRSNVCIEYGLYEGIITLKPYSEGYHITYTRCCRNVQKNIVQTGADPTQGQTYYCYIPNTSLENNSPAFYGVPSPYMCVNDTTSFLFDAVDRDGDSLAYTLMRPYSHGGIGFPVPEPSLNLDTPLLSYNPGYSWQQPFGASGGAFVDNRTGLTSFYATETGNYVVGIEVREYRNGILLSRTRLDLQIIVLDCRPNKRPQVSINTSNRLQIEAGTELCFTVSASDEDDLDAITLTGRGSVLGDGGGIGGGTLATFTDASGISEVESEFCWIPDCDAARSQPYIVYFTAEDDGCPPKFNSLDVLIDVIPFEGAEDLDGPIEVCQRDDATYKVLDGNSSSDFEWEITEGNIVSDNTLDSVVINWSGTGTGTIRVREVSAAGCLGDWMTLDVTIVESPPNPAITGKDTVCDNETNLQYSVGSVAGVSYYWNAINATIGFVSQNEITMGTLGIPTFTIEASLTNALGCRSDTVQKEVFVSIPMPVIDGPTVVCPNSVGVEYFAQGSSNNSTFTWSVLGGVVAQGDGTSTISVDWAEEGIGEVEVIEINKFGCSSEPIALSVAKSYTLSVASITGPAEICEFDLGVAYNVVASNGSVYDWTILGGQQSAGDSSENIAVDWKNAGVGSVSVVQRAIDAVNNRECISLPFTLPVTIFPKPSASDIIGEVEVCQASGVYEYTIAGFPNSTFSWAVNGDDQNIDGQGTNTIKISWDQSGTFTISVQELSENNCPGDVIDTLIVVNPKPVTSPVVGTDVICPSNYETQIYTVNGAVGSSFIWSIDGSFSVIEDGSNSVTVTWDTLVDVGLLKVVEVSDEGCEGDTVRLNVEIDRLNIDLRFVSVGTPDNRMSIDWQLLNNSTADELRIEKRDAGSTGSWTPIATVPGTQTNYTELNINTDEKAFQYRIAGENKCDVTIRSEEHTSILLTGFQDESFNSQLTFTDYFGWVNGVSFYDLLLEDNISSYRVELANANSNTNLLLVHDPKQYRKCFRVQASENGGEETSSLSNEVCFYFSPEVYVPSGFTPNGDGLNDGFGVKGVAINTFEISIYNRWGEKLYNSQDIDEKWIPEYRGEDIQMGTYVYLITYTDFEDKVYQKSGTINLLR